MRVKYYAEAMNESNLWQVVCKDTETQHRKIIAENLVGMSARLLAGDLQKAGESLLVNTNSETEIN
jgi:hypothetical protein